MSDNQINKRSTLKKIHSILHDNLKDKNSVITTIHSIVEESLKDKKAEIIAIRTAMCIGFWLSLFCCLWCSCCFLLPLNAARARSW